MTASTEALRAERVDAVLALAAGRLSAADRQRLEPFAREYFRQVDTDDLAERRPEDLLGALLSHWQFGAQRDDGHPKVRVFSPTVAEDGWGTRHSVVEIVNDDMPFLVDSVTMEIKRQGHVLHLIVHPVYAVSRDAKGALQSAQPRAQAAEAPRESWMYIEVDRLVDAQQRARLAEGLERVLRDVKAAVADWKPMLARLQEATEELGAASSVPADQREESRAFLQWLAEDHITLLGYRQHALVDAEGETALRAVPGTGLGLLRGGDDEGLSASFSALPAAARALAKAPVPPLVVTKANTRSTVHRDGYTDYVGIKRYNPQGEVIGEHRFIGLFTSTAYSARVAETPLLRGKAGAIVARAGFSPGGHLAKALQHILETYPRDDLFQIPDAQLYDSALGILALGERQRLRLFTWSDPFGRFVSCLVFVPREAYSTDLRVKFQRILIQGLGGSSAEFDVLLSGTTLARIHFTVRTTPGQVPAFDRLDLERKLAAVARRWDDDLRDALVDGESEAAGLRSSSVGAGRSPRPTGRP
jgi:glutamate dehydrogenase